MTLPGGRANGLAMQVDRDNVLQARALLLQEADRLDAVLLQARGRVVNWERCGGDPVSADAAIAFPERASALFDSCQKHNDDLRAAALELEAIARTYGFTEAAIVAAVPFMQPISVALNASTAAYRAG